MRTATAVLLVTIVVAFGGVSRVPVGAQAGASFDVLIRNGLLVDGTGAHGRVTNLGIRDGRVAEMGGFELLLQKVRMWFETFALVLPELNEVPMHYVGKSEDGSAWLLELDVMEGLACQCLVDRKTHLPKEYSFNLGSEALHYSSSKRTRQKGRTALS